MRVGQTTDSGVGGVDPLPPLGERACVPAFSLAESPPGPSGTPGASLPELHLGLSLKGERGRGVGVRLALGGLVLSLLNLSKPWLPMSRATGMGCPVHRPGTPGTPPHCASGQRCTLPVAASWCGCGPSPHVLRVPRHSGLPVRGHHKVGVPSPKARRESSGWETLPSCPAPVSSLLCTHGLPWRTGLHVGVYGGGYGSMSRASEVHLSLLHVAFLRSLLPSTRAHAGSIVSIPPAALPVPAPQSSWAHQVCREPSGSGRGSLLEQDMTWLLWVMASGRDLSWDSWGPGGAPSWGWCPLSPRPLNLPPPLELVLLGPRPPLPGPDPLSGPWPSSRVSPVGRSGVACASHSRADGCGLCGSVQDLCIPPSGTSTPQAPAVPPLGTSGRS